MDNTNLDILISLKKGIDSQIVGLQGQSDALKVAIDLQTNGYQSDQDAISQQISDGVTAALQPINDAISATLTKNEKIPAQTATL